MTQEGPREHYLDSNTMQALQKRCSLQVNKIYIRGILRDGDVIEVRSEGEISIDNDNLLVPENLPVLEAVAQGIFSGKFDHNGL